MKLWGWWRKEEPKLLEDLPPKHEDGASLRPAPQIPTLSQTLGGIGYEDFKALPQMPCFRNAMLTGLGMGLTASTIIFVSKRAVNRAINYAIGGFIVGSVITWEQCRFRLYRSKRNVQKAKELYRRSDEQEK